DGQGEQRRASALPVRAGDPVQDYPRQLLAGLAELFLTGLRRVDVRGMQSWQELVRLGEALGFSRLVGQVEVLARALEAKRRTTSWDWQPAGRAALHLAVLTQLAEDLAG